jgi:hypothetical protein
VITGLLVRPFPTTSSQDGLGTSTPPTSGVIDRLKRGYMTVRWRSAPRPRTAGLRGHHRRRHRLLGDIVTSASPAGGGTGVAVAGCFFTGPADANGIVEIAYNI